MLFSSFTFLFWFLPLTLALYFAPALFKPRSTAHVLAWQNAVLLVASLFFYAFGEPLFVLLMLATSFGNAGLALLIVRVKHRAVPLILAIALDVGLLLFFKYPPLFGFAARRLPLGISFYTFQAISYVADVYKKRVAPAKNPFTVLLYIALFPQLIAGPIVRYTDINDALRERRVTWQGAADGVSRFAVGLAKKVLLANSAGALFRTFALGGTASFLGAWCALLGFAFQIYFDFSGYTDMAIGLGLLFGFRFPENFRYPYIARSVTDFWRRWHISLSSFFKEYVYIPLGGNRRGKARTLLNLLIVWSLTGLWHGASLNFLLWGLYYFLLLSTEKFLFPQRNGSLSRAIAVPLTFLATLGGWVLFAFDGSTPNLALSAIPSFLLALAGLGDGGFAVGNDLFSALHAIPPFLLCAVGATPFPRRLAIRLRQKRISPLLGVALPLLALVVSVASLADAAYNPFLYFRF